MDVSILAPDEFEVECQVRKLTGDPLNRLASLQVAIANEIKNPVLKPFRAHAAARSSPQRELQRCALKIKDHREWITNLKPDAKTTPEELRKVEVRLFHIQARLERLLSSTRSYKVQCQELLTMVGLVVSGVQTIMQGNDNLDETLNKIKEAQSEDPNELSTSEDEESSIKPNSTDESSQLTSPSPTNKNETTIGNMSQILSSTNVAQEGRPAPASTPNNIGNDIRNANHSQYQASNIISKWKLTFDGDSQDLPIERFLFRVEHLAETSGIPSTNLVNNLGNLLTGAALNWYWCHIERNTNIDWSQLKLDLLERFQDRRTEHDIRRVIESRKQQISEPFRVFYNDILALSLQCRVPLPDSEILHIVRRNMRPGLQVVLADKEIPTITMLIQRCLALEDTWKRTGYEPEKLCSRKIVEEVYLNETTNDYSGYRQAKDICSIQTGSNDARQRVAYPTSNHTSTNHMANNDSINICWNCQDIGHKYTDCSNPPKIFCFGCGRAGILKPKCFRCSGNSAPRSQMSGNLTPRPPSFPGTNLMRAHTNHAEPQTPLPKSTQN